MIVRMNRIEIVAARRDVDAVASTLQNLGVLHLEEAPLALEGAPAELHRMQLNDTQIAEEALYREINDMLRPALVLVHAARPGARPPARMREEIELLPRGELLRRTTLLAGAARSLLRRDANLTDDLEIIGRYEKALRGLGKTLETHTFGKDLALKGILIDTDVKATGKHLHEQLKQITGDRYRLRLVKMAGGRRAALIAIPREASRAVGTMLWKRGVSEVVFPAGFDGLPLQEKIARLAEQAARLPERREKLREERSRFAQENTDEVLAIQARAADHLTRLEKVTAMAHSECAFAMTGWLPHDRVGLLRETLGKRFGNTAVVRELDLSRVHRTDVPVQLRNNRFFRPFELLLSIFPLPTYGTLDPTKLVAIGFPLFFGFILGDAGYGAVLLLLSLFFRRKFRHNAIVRDVTFIGMTCALVTIAYGLLFGEIFGNLGRLLYHSPFERTEKPVKDALMMIAIGMGAFHIGLSLALGIWASAKEKSTRHLLERTGLMLWFLALMVGADIMLKFGILGLGWAVPGGLTGVGIVLIAIGHPASLMELMSIFTNILSYVRLFAFAIASVSLSDLANDTPHMIGNLPLGIGLAVFMHIMNFALGVFEPTIQSLRLHYVEFLPKFHHPEGRDYRPFRTQEVVS